MKRFNGVISDVVGILNEAAFLNALINAGILFLVLYLVLTLINFFPLVLSIIFSTFYLLNVWIKKTEKYSARYVEKKFPFLRDRLTTAKDTMKEDNFVISRLRIDVARRLNKVDASSFFAMGDSIFKVFIIIGIIFSLMFITIIDYRIFDGEAALGGLNLDFSFGTGDELFKRGGNDNSGGGLEFNVPETVDLTDIQDAEDKGFKKEQFVSYEDLEAIGAEEYKDPITEEEKEIVKNYFNKINE
jgi:hypothetical protein